MKLQGSGLFHPKTLQSQNCQPAKNRLSLNGLEFVHGQLSSPSGGCLEAEAETVPFGSGHNAGPPPNSRVDLPEMVDDLLIPAFLRRH